MRQLVAGSVRGDDLRPRHLEARQPLERRRRGQSPAKDGRRVPTSHLKSSGEVRRLQEDLMRRDSSCVTADWFRALGLDGCTGRGEEDGALCRRSGLLAERLQEDFVLAGEEEARQADEGLPSVGLLCGAGLVVGTVL